MGWRTTGKTTSVARKFPRTVSRGPMLRESSGDETEEDDFGCMYPEQNTLIQDLIKFVVFLQRSFSGGSFEKEIAAKSKKQEETALAPLRGDLKFALSITSRKMILTKFGPQDPLQNYTHR